jgi:hypothetical protein
VQPKMHSVHGCTIGAATCRQHQEQATGFLAATAHQCSTNAHGITEMSRIHSVLFGMQNRTFGPYLATLYMILIPVMWRLGHDVHLAVPVPVSLV